MKTVLVWILKAYRAVISPLYGQVCRYHPSCSAYALESVQVHGAARGSWLAVRRLVRCHPWTPGGYDPVPPRNGENETAQSTAAAISTTPSDSVTADVTDPIRGGRLADSGDDGSPVISSPSTPATSRGARA